SNLHRTTYPSPPLRSAQAAQEGQFILRGGGPSDYKIVVICYTTTTADGASNLTWRQGARRTQRPAARSSRTCDGAPCPIHLVVTCDGAPGPFRAIEDDLPERRVAPGAVYALSFLG